MLCRGKETIAVAVNTLVQSLSLSLSLSLSWVLCFSTRIGIRLAAAVVQGKGRERGSSGGET